MPAITIAGELTAGAALIVMAVAVAVLVWRRGFQRLAITLGSMSVSLDAVERRVNGVPHDHPTIPQRLATIEHRLDRIDTRLDAIEAKPGVTLHYTPTPTPTTENLL